MPIGTSDGEYFDNHFEGLVEKTSEGRAHVKVTQSPNVEDRTAETTFTYDAPSRFARDFGSEPSQYFFEYPAGSKTRNPLAKAAGYEDIKPMSPVEALEWHNNYEQMNDPWKGGQLPRDQQELLKDGIEPVFSKMPPNPMGQRFAGMPPGGSTEPAGALNPDTGTQQPVRPELYGLNPPERGPGFSNEERPPAKVLYKTASPLVNITDHDIEDATNIAMSAGPGTMMGVQSKTFNFENLHKAADMFAAKEHPDKIWQETGTFTGADAWSRQEIPDIGSALKKENMAVNTTVVNNPTGWSHVEPHGTVLESVGIKPADRIPQKDVAPPKDINDFDRWYKEFSGEKAKPTILRDVLDHPELYKAYPELETLKLYNLKDYKGGLGGNIEGVHTDDGIFMKNANPTQFRSVLLHEVQHAIQKIENFGRGGNPGMFKPEALIPVEENFNKIKHEALSDINKRTGMNHFELGMAIGAVKSNLERGVAPDAGSMFKGLVEKLKSSQDFDKIVNIAKSQKLLDDAAKEWFEKYQRLSGEVESRNVQKRADMIRLERKYQNPMDTEDRPRSMQIVR